MRALHSRNLALGIGLLVGLMPVSALAKIGDAAGVTGAVQGEVTLESPARQTSIDQVASGEDVVMGDAVNTRAQARLQIMLLDQTAITMGENASLVIDEFVYDPDNADASGQPTADGGPFFEDLEDIYGDAIPLADLGYESTTNLPSGQLTYFADDTPMTGGPGAIGDYDVSYSLDLASRDFNGSINVFAQGTSIGTINGTFQLLHNPFDQGFDHLHETGAVITTPDNDTISVDYSIGPNQVDTAVVYIVNPTFGGPVTLSGAGPAPIVP